MAQLKAVACELPSELGVPISRFSRAELHRLVIERGVTEASAATIARWLAEDALKPWQHRSWVFPRDPRFLERAGPVLDLYPRRWKGRLLHPGEYVICADEKTQIQARQRAYPTAAPAPGRPQRIEHDYDRGGALGYLAAWDVHRGQLTGRCEQQTGIAPFGRLIEHVMTRDPYRKATRVFWIIDNSSSPRGQASIDRVQAEWPNLGLVHLPFHASWLNQIEIVFSVIQRKVLTPNDFPSLQAIVDRLDAFEHPYNRIATPFDRTFTRDDLEQLIARVAQHEPRLRLAA
ncbi:MAG: IS630 family transposase [Solirubrobacterales bacterium]|nr:IS630 family transposase [Solirubrobacterales bacterium]